MEKKLKVDYNLQYSAFTFHNFLRNDALYGLLALSGNFLVFSIKYFFIFSVFLFFKTKKIETKYIFYAFLIFLVFEKENSF